MNKQTLIRFIATSLVGVALATSALAQAKLDKASQLAKVVIQVSDAEPAKWNLALNNAKNVQEELGVKNVEIEIVAYGPGIGMLKFDAPAASRVGDAVKAGIKVVACENTMRAQKLTKADMNAEVGYVSAGVVEIMQRQAQGWAYIRP